MEINTLEDLLFEDWTWRKTEISELIILAETEQKNVLLKSIILLLYAHWEGYIKKASKTYLKFIVDNEHQVSQLADNFKYLALKGLSKQVCSSSDTMSSINELNFILKYNDINTKTIDKLYTVDLENERDKSIINTQDNLTPAIFKNILDIIGVTYLDGYESKKTQIETNLVAHRNSIGHGNKKLSNNQEFQLEIVALKELREIIFLIIENFRDDIIQFAKEQYFLKDNLSLISNYSIMREEKIIQDFNEIQMRYNNG